MQYPICALNFANNISRPGWTWYNLWKLLAIKFMNTYFHNSVDQSGIYHHIPSWLANFLKFTVIRLLENEFVKLLCPWNDVIINPPYREVTSKFVPPPKKTKVVPHLLWKAFRKIPPYFMGVRHYAVAPLENDLGCMTPQYFNELQIKTC